MIMLVPKILNNIYDISCLLFKKLFEKTNCVRNQQPKEVESCT